MDIKKELFGEIAGEKVYRFTLSNENGMLVKILNYGGIVTHLFVTDKTGQLKDVVLGYDNLEGYLDKTPYFGAIVGRYGNRIANGKFELNGRHFTLPLNAGTTTLHGGIKGFDKVIWQAEEFISDEGTGIVLKYRSPDGEEGFPGNLDVEVTYTLTLTNELKISYRAKTDKPTIINLTHHSYFNLKGEGNGNILGHEMQIFAKRFLPVGDALIPTGSLSPVINSAMDFTTPHTIGSRILDVDGGYDHTWVLDAYDGKNIFLAAKVIDHKSGRVMEVYTDQPGVQFYTGNFLDGEITGKQGKPYEKHNGFCLETQHFPDSPNQANFPSVVLRPDENYETETIYKFLVEK